MITIAITTILVTLILGLVTIVSVSLFSSAKYSNSDRIAAMEEQMAAWAGEKKLNPVEIHDRLVALENRAGVMIGQRR